MAVIKTAIISDCGLYRYTLTRQWGISHLLPIIMLNPSTADADTDDPTIRRCMSFGRRESFGGIHVVNLFAFRATSPEDMKAEKDPFGTHGKRHLVKILRNAKHLDIPVLAAWGVHGVHRDQDKYLKMTAEGIGTKMVCLGVTKDGHPRHPLYVRGDQPFIPFGGV